MCVCVCVRVCWYIRTAGLYTVDIFSGFFSTEAKLWISYVSGMHRTLHDVIQTV